MTDANGYTTVTVNRLTRLAGVKIGEADVRVIGLRCGQPALVA